MKLRALCVSCVGVSELTCPCAVFCVTVKGEYPVVEQRQWKEGALRGALLVVVCVSCDFVGVGGVVV